MGTTIVSLDGSSSRDVVRLDDLIAATIEPIKILAKQDVNDRELKRGIAMLLTIPFQGHVAHSGGVEIKGKRETSWSKARKLIRRHIITVHRVAFVLLSESVSLHKEVAMDILNEKAEEDEGQGNCQ